MADLDAQRAWVTRVLGFSFPQSAPARAALGNGDLLPLWVAAKEQADAAIGSLQRVLKENGDPDLQQIAEYGLHGLTRDENVQMMVALREVAAGTPAGPDKLAAAVDSYRAFLGSTVVDVLEDNPFGVTVPLRAVLAPALDTLARHLPA